MFKRVFLIGSIAFLYLTCSAQKHYLSTFVKDGRYGLVDSDGKVVVDPIYDVIDQQYHGLRVVRLNGLWGVMNDRGKLIVKCKYNYLSDFEGDGYAQVRQDGKYGFINEKGKLVVPCLYDYTWFFHEGLVCVQKGDKWGFIDERNRTVIPFDYDDFGFSRFRQGLVTACKDRRWGFIDKKNRVVIPLKYKGACSFSEGLAAVQDENWKWGFIDQQGEIVVPFSFDGVESCIIGDLGFQNGLAKVEIAGNWGFVDMQGKMRIPCIYYTLGCYYNGYAAVMIDNGKRMDWKDHKVLFYGYIDSTGAEYLMPYEEYWNHDWAVAPHPAALPDYSDTLKHWPVEPVEDWFSGGVMDGVYVKEYSQDSLRPIDTTAVEEVQPPVVDTPTVTIRKGERWTMESLLNTSLNAFVCEPRSYPDLNQNTQVAISYGLLMGGGNYSEDFMYPSQEGWQVFKKNTVYAIISSEELRSLAWDWVSPYYKKAFQCLHPFHKKTYKDIALSLKNYINTYDLEKTKAYLERDEPHFAHYDADGKKNPYRKLFAFVDRLILVHKVISLEDAKRWINLIVDEVLSW
jgi:hypothetical protein